MSSSLPVVRPGYHSVNPALAVRNAAAAIGFYEQAFGATVRLRLDEPGGKVAHAELQIGDSVVMISDEYPEWGALSPESIGGSAAKLNIYVSDADATIARAEAAGATVVMPAKDQFYGDRSGQVRDPFGHTWALSTFIEDVSNEEMHRRFAQWFAPPETSQ